jgi:hypothetical protein
LSSRVSLLGIITGFSGGPLDGEQLADVLDRFVGQDTLAVLLCRLGYIEELAARMRPASDFEGFGLLAIQLVIVARRIGLQSIRPTQRN